jgi:hypothetical protein
MNVVRIEFLALKKRFINENYNKKGLTQASQLFLPFLAELISDPLLT